MPEKEQREQRQPDPSWAYYLAVSLITVAGFVCATVLLLAIPGTGGIGLLISILLLTVLFGTGMPYPKRRDD